MPVQLHALTGARADLDRMHLSLPERISVPATFRWSGQTITDVGVRCKGDSTSAPESSQDVLIPKNGVDLTKFCATAGVLSEEESASAPQFSFQRCHCRRIRALEPESGGPRPRC